MIVFLFIGVLLKIFLAYGQQYPRFFEKEDLKELGFLSTHNNPNPVVKQYYDPKPTTVSRNVRLHGRAPKPAKFSERMEYGRQDNFGMKQPKPKNLSPRHTSTEDMALLLERVDKAGKWDEFIELTNKQKEKFNGQVDPNWEQDVKRWAAYSRSLVEEQPQTRQQPTSKIRSRPSAGFNEYWGKDDVEANEPPYRPQRGKPPGFQEYWNRDSMNPEGFNGYQGNSQMAPPRQYHPRDLSKSFSAKQIMDMAHKKLEGLETGGAQSAGNQLPQGRTEHTNTRTNEERIPSPADNNANAKTYEDRIPPPPENVQSQPADTGSDVPYNKFLPKTDDFGSPIRWVPYNSNETEDGLAKVTDPSTGKNRQYLINGMVLVPISDNKILRIGLSSDDSTTPSPPVHTTDTSALKVIVSSVDAKSADDRDWLAFETVLGMSRFHEKCDSDGCQARCHKTGCESVCLGDTCATGCVGASCNSFCKGPGCFSMCIGEECSARCEGMSCEARCRGRDCDASCRRFSCQYTVNGAFHMGAGTWEQMYPQYDTRSHGPSGYDPSIPTYG